MSARTIAGWVLSVLPSLMFAFAAYLKLTGNAAEVDGFRLFGLPIWFMYVVGVAELTGVGLLLFTRQRLAGAAILCVVGLGAAFEHATHEQLGMAPIPLALAALAVVGALLRDAQAKMHAAGS
jgi:hypothetical protein